MSGSDLSHRRLPYMQANSSHEGPTVWLTACCHGDEVGGIVVVQEVFKRLKKNPLQKGALHAFPLMNPLGFEAGARHVTLSEEDLNRAFPGNVTGTLAERIAATIFDAIVATSPSIVLDLHNDWIRSIPYTVLDSPSEGGATIAEQRAQQLATTAGFLTVTEPNPLRRTLSHSLLRCGIPAITIELGESFVVNETNVQFGVNSILQTLAQLEMVEATEPFAYPAPAGIPQRCSLRYSQTPVASTSGIIRFLVRPGAVVKAGQPVATVVNAFGRLQETVRAEQAAIVLGLSDSSVAFPGAPIMAFGQF
ncbi:MAG: succinylglutamate desuccinylase/aspartoacylase family protein [Planctomycetales bacterium]|nr:succinylglutamate desuccinylase/aspartoacylase family protein [Planctomycetales bacterium]